ncbi:MAG: CRISPR-associated endonuclease Cas2 [Patescibacteria group bacterium]
MDKKIKILINDLPFKVGASSLAIIMCLGEGVFKILGGILEGPSRLTVGKAAKIGGNLGSVQQYYKEIKRLRENSLHTALWRLNKKGLIKKKNNGFQLTSIGLKYFKRIKNNQFKKWDGKWRIVMFDIPEKSKKEREWLRNQLYGLEYKSLQKSVFIGKFPLSEDLFREIFKKSLRDYVNLITVGEIDNEEILNSFN